MTTHPKRKDRTEPMLLILVALVVVMALAGLVTAFAAYPDRGQPIPHAQRLTDQVKKIRDHTEA